MRRKRDEAARNVLVGCNLNLAGEGDQRPFRPTEHTRRTAATFAPYRPARPRLRSPSNQDGVQTRGRTADIAPAGDHRRQSLQRCPRSPTHVATLARRRAWRQESDSVAEHRRNPRACRPHRLSPQRAKDCEAAAAPVPSRARESCSPSSPSSRRLDWHCGKR